MLCDQDAPRARRLWRHAGTHQGHAAFTMVELLIVVAVIGVLIAMLLPAVQAARRAARTAQCLNNMHQIGVALAMYTDTDGHYPWTYHAGTAESWIVTLAPYVENLDQVRLCPEDPLGAQRVSANAGGIRGTSYVINEYVADTTNDGYSCQNINFVRSTHSLPILFEGANYGRTAADDHVHCSTWYAPLDVAQGTVLNVMTAEINPQEHIDCANYLYGDGHALTVPYTTFLGWVQTDIANQTNFARPQK